MSDIQDAITALDTKVDALIAKIATGTNETANIAALKTIGDKIQAALDAATPPSA